MIGRGFTLIEVMIAVLVLAFTLGAAVESNSSVINTQLELDLRYHAHRVLTDVMIACYIKKGKHIPEEAKLDCDEQGEAEYRDGFLSWRRSWEPFEIKEFKKVFKEEHPFLVQTISVFVPASAGDDHRIGLIRTHYVGDEEDPV